MQGDTTGVVESVCGRDEPDSAGCGARMRQPENPQEATGVYTRKALEIAS
jgi:hypothetical protein